MPETSGQPGAERSSAIPNHLLFVWFGKVLPSFARVAILSALRHNPDARVSLLHGDSLVGVESLARESRLELRTISIEALLARASEVSAQKPGPPLDTQRLRRVWHSLSTPAARSNLVRLLVLYAEGGVYLDTDTITLRSLAPLLDRSAFCGTEHILWPKDKLRPSHPQFWLRGPALMGLRYVLAHVPYGFRLQRRLLPWYDVAVNNAVLGFAQGHELIHRALERVTELDSPQWTKRFRLGTHLLQEVIDEAATRAIDLLSPEHFYPLGPVTSLHYLRRYPDAAALARELLGDQTYVVHWYASVANLARCDERYIREHAGHVIFAHLCQPIVDVG
jgi:Glycosyltransferase sugar-binding region containing DXD motif